MDKIQKQRNKDRSKIHDMRGEYGVKISLPENRIKKLDPVKIKRPTSVDLGELDRQTHPWLYVVPGNKVRQRDCDERPDEFIRVGIGVCFKGRTLWSLTI